MNPHDAESLKALAELVTTPGALLVTLFFFHHRIKRLESNQSKIMLRFGIPAEKKRRKKSDDDDDDSDLLTFVR